MTRLNIALASFIYIFLVQSPLIASAAQFQFSHLKSHSATVHKLLPQKVHSWDKLERKHKYPGISEVNRFRREGLTWDQFKRKYRRQIRRFARNNNDQFERGNEAFYFYNYRYGYITDNCEFIRAPVRFCYYDDDRDKRRCKWRRKWKYKCF